MQFLEDDNIILLGEVSALASLPAHVGRQLAVAAAGCLLLLPFMLLVAPLAAFQHDSWSTIIPIELGMAVAIGVLVFARWIYIALFASRVDAVVFHRTTSTVELVQPGIYGNDRVVIPFREIRAIRMTRGEWDGESAVEIPVLILHSHQSVMLPPVLTGRDLELLKALTGIRGA